MVSMPPVLANVLLAALTGIVFACTSAVVETATFHAFRWLEARGAVRRFAPDIQVTMTRYQVQTFKTFICSVTPAAFVLWSLKEQLAARAVLDWNLLNVFAFVWTGAVAHDAWFFALHMIMHKFKPLYRRLHQKHHMLEGDLTVFGTGDMEILEAFLLFMGYYMLVLCVCLMIGSWNPVAFVALIVAESSMNMGGHSGYDMPFWLHLLVTFGVGITPLSATSRVHYIHHLDPRFNRALYFTWWDRIFGTFKDSHPRITIDRMSAIHAKQLLK